MLPSAACEWKAQLPIPPPEVLAKHTRLTKNFLLFAQLLTVQPDFSDQHRHSKVQPRGPSPASELFLSGIPLPLEAGKEGRKAPACTGVGKQAAATPAGSSLGDEPQNPKPVPVSASGLWVRVFPKPYDIWFSFHIQKSSSHGGFRLLPST